MNPPGLDGLRGLYAAVQVLRDPRLFIDEQAHRLGPVWTTRMPDGNRRLGKLYWMMGPDANERILAPEYKADFTWYGGYRFTMEPIIGRDVLTLLDDTTGWPGLRYRDRRLAPVFRPQLDDEYAPVMLQIVERCMSEWPVGPKFDLQWQCKRIAFGIVARVVTGAVDDELPELLHDFEALGLGLFSVLHLPIPGTRFGRGKAAQKRLAEFLRRKIASLRARGDLGRSVLGQLLRPPADGEAPLAEETLIAEMMAFFIMGYDTMASLLTSLFAELGDHPAERRLVVDEARALPDLSPAALATASAVDQALLETERLHPPLVFSLRGVARSFTFRGFDIPAGEMVAYSAHYTGRMAELFDAPTEFRPRRFASGVVAPYSLLTFGGGHRACIGKRFARFEATLIASAILRQFDIELLPRSEAVFFNPMIQRKHGLPARVTRVR